MLVVNGMNLAQEALRGLNVARTNHATLNRIEQIKVCQVIKSKDVLEAMLMVNGKKRALEALRVLNGPGTLPCLRRHGLETQSMIVT